jgi:gliding motility-associated-like protein
MSSGDKLWKNWNINYLGARVNNLYYISSASTKRLFCHRFFLVLSGIIIILCHKAGPIPAIDLNSVEGFSFSHRIFNPANPYKRKVADINERSPSRMVDKGSKPKAEDDSATTPEETPATINPLDNDRSGGRKNDNGDDNREEEDFEIDRSTVDLAPGTDGLQQTKTTEAGFYSVDNSGKLTFLPALDFFGVTSIRYTVNSTGNETSNEATISLTVINVNDAPEIMGQNPPELVAKAGKASFITLDNLIVKDPDNGVEDFSLEVLHGHNYAVSGNAVTPDKGFSGLLTVPVIVTDQQANSQQFSVSMIVSSDNEEPVITGQSPLSTTEDTGLTVTLNDLSVTDPDNSYPAGFSLRLSDGSNYSISGDMIIPSQNFSGTLQVPVVVNDGSDDSDPFILQVAVTAVNDAPVITGQRQLSTPEDQTVALELSDLTVSDVDNSYPNGFTLSVLAGEHYSVSGNLITPETGFNGALSVPVFVNDGNLNSEFFNIGISVNPTNDAPVITGQRALTVIEDNGIILTLQDLTVSDPDNAYPDGFTLSVQAGTDYTFSGNTVTPVPNFTGLLSVNTIVNDGSSNSAPFGVQISVSPVNDSPLITGQQVLTTAEDVSRTIELADLIVSDPDNVYPDGFSLIVSPGTNYTLSENTVVPSLNYSGPLTVQVQVNDGSLNSNIFNLSLQVTPVDDPPVITGQVPVSIAEDASYAIGLSDLSVLDVDNIYPNGFSLAIGPGTNYSATGSTVTPTLNFTGTLNVAITVNDGTNSSAPFAFQIQVGDANDPPVITGQASVSTDEEKPFTVALSQLLVSDPDNVYPTGFSLTVSPGTNYTVIGNTITPAVNFAGVLTIPVRVSDGVNNSATFNFQLQVNQINDPPSFAAIANQEISENAAAASLVITGISKGPNEGTQQLTFVATSSNTSIIDDPSIQYDGVAATAVLSYVVKPNMSGVVTITIVAIDNGSNLAPNQNSFSSGFQIQVLEINTAPTLDLIGDVTLTEDAGLQNVPLTGISPGAGETQTLTLNVTSNKPEFFEQLEVAYTSPASTGLLTFMPAANIFGTAQITVTATDNGSGVIPNINSTARTFTVTVEPVNDPPVFFSDPVTVAAVDEVYRYNIVVTDPDNESVTISAAGKPSWTTFAVLENGKARLSGTPPSSALGNVEVLLQAKDAFTTVDQAFSIYVNVRPTISSLSTVTEEDTPYIFTADFFANGYTDLNENPLAAIQLTSVPGSGTLTLSGNEVTAGDTIPTAALSTLTYTPGENIFGFDSFSWKAFDGYHFTLEAATVDITVLPINDRPDIVFEKDTLVYEVNGEPDFLSPALTINDPDNDTLVSATVGFYAQNFVPQIDILQYENTARIKGKFDLQTGILELVGKATVAAYSEALRTIKYLHDNTLDPVLVPKTVYFTLNDGEDEGEPRDKIIVLQYTFIEFEIPSAFTPNGDHANDTWIIDRPGGLDELEHAVISVYNKRGVLVFRTKGFNRPWDGTMNGELLPADTYYFTIDLQLRNKKTYKGAVTLLR